MRTLFFKRPFLTLLSTALILAPMLPSGTGRAHAEEPSPQHVPEATVTNSVYGPSSPSPLAGDGEWRFDFGPGAVADGYIQVQASTAYSAELKYGFAEPAKVSGADRGTPDPVRSDFAMPQDTSFLVDLPSGDYTVSLIAGDEAEPTDIAIKAERMQKVQPAPKPAGQYLEMDFDVALVDGRLNLEFSGSAPKINALVIRKLPDRQPGGVPTAYIASDSTAQTYDPYWDPQAGWGQMIDRYFTGDVRFDNRAIGGRSSKTFITEGRLDDILRSIVPGDYLLIQFGHNDATISRPDRYASPEDYKGYLKNLRAWHEGTRRNADPHHAGRPQGF